MKQTFYIDQEGYQWHTVPKNNTKLMLKKSEISTKIDVYSYRRAHWHASCSAGV